MQGRHVTLRLLWLEWKETTPTAGATRSSAGTTSSGSAGQDVVMRLSYRAGERMFVDFSGDTMQVFDQATGESRKGRGLRRGARLLGPVYVEATRGQDLRSWLSAHEHAYAFYGGVSRGHRAG